MKSKALLVLLIIVLIIIGVLWYFKPSQEKEDVPPGPEDYNIEEEGALIGELDEIEQYAINNYPTGPYTTVELQDKRILFGGEKYPHEVFFFEGTLFGDMNTIVIDGIEFMLSLENPSTITEGDYFYVLMENLTEDYEEFLSEPFVVVAKRKIEFNKVSTEPIAFPIFDPETFEPLIQINYNYFISKSAEGKPEIFFLLSKQDFKLQFKKNLRFAGTDSLEQKQPNLPYYMPDLEFFGNNATDSKHFVAWIQLDEDNDKEFEVNAFVDTATGQLLNVKKYGLQKYPFAVEFEGKGISSEEQKVTDSFGTIFEIIDSHLYARMPKKE